MNDPLERYRKLAAKLLASRDVRRIGERQASSFERIAALYRGDTYSQIPREIRASVR
jgi:hypothetical protein